MYSCDSLQWLNDKWPQNLENHYYFVLKFCAHESRHTVTVGKIWPFSQWILRITEGKIQRLEKQSTGGLFTHTLAPGAGKDLKWDPRITTLLLQWSRLPHKGWLVASGGGRQRQIHLVQVTAWHFMTWAYESGNSKSRSYLELWYS